MRLVTVALGSACLALGTVCPPLPVRAGTVTPVQRQAAIAFVRHAAQAATPCLHDFAPTIVTHPRSADEIRHEDRQTSLDCQRSSRALRHLAVPSVLDTFPQFRQLKAALYDATMQGHVLAQAALQHPQPTASMAAMTRALGRDEATIGALLPQIQRDMGIARF